MTTVRKEWKMKKLTWITEDNPPNSPKVFHLHWTDAAQIELRYNSNHDAAKVTLRLEGKEMFNRISRDIFTEKDAKGWALRTTQQYLKELYFTVLSAERELMNTEAWHEAI